MHSTLQDFFVESHGSPVRVGEWLVSQLCRIPIRHGSVTFHLSSAVQQKGKREPHVYSCAPVVRPLTCVGERASAVWTASVAAPQCRAGLLQPSTSSVPPFQP